jgi:hypothetical protein
VSLPHIYSILSVPFALHVVRIDRSVVVFASSILTSSAWLISMQFSAQSWRRQSLLAYKELWNDFKSHPYTAVITLWFFALIISIVALCVVTDPSLALVPTPCFPDGSFQLDGDFSVWKHSDFFEVTLGAGRLSFSEAKLIDVVWDVVSR